MRNEGVCSARLASSALKRPLASSVSTDSEPVDGRGAAGCPERPAELTKSAGGLPNERRRAFSGKAAPLYSLRRYEDAIKVAMEARRIRPHGYSLQLLAASYAQLGRGEETKNALSEMLTLPGGRWRRRGGAWSNCPIWPPWST
jgi:tetratricopeptide (TPR) repeat protein